MAVGKSTMLDKIKNKKVLKSSDVHGGEEETLLTNWYTGKYSVALWERFCVRWYMGKESEALFKIVDNPSIKAVVFDRSCIDCLCFGVAMSVNRFYTEEADVAPELTHLHSYIIPCFEMIMTSIQHIRGLNRGKIVYVEIASDFVSKNIKKRNRSSEKFSEGDVWNPSCIFQDEDAHEMFNNIYGYTSLIVGNMLCEFFLDDFFLGTTLPSKDEIQSFKFLKRSENVDLDIFKTPIKLSHKNDFFQLNKWESWEVNLSRFITTLFQHSLLINLKSFPRHEIFDGVVCGDSSFLANWLEK